MQRPEITIGEVGTSPAIGRGMQPKKITIASFLLLAACLSPGSIDDYVESLGRLPSDPARHEETVGPVEVVQDGTSQRICQTNFVEETRQLDQVVAYSANSESMWPGAILRGDSIYSGLFTQAVFDRKPARVSISLSNLAGEKSFVMDQPSLSTYREGLGEILAADVTGATPANIYAEIEEVYSEKQLSLALGADVAWLPGGVKASFDFSTGTQKARYLVKFVQSYFTVDLDQPGRAADFFADSVTAEEVADKLPEGAPVYVSSVTYGRMVLFGFESDRTHEELGAALDFVYRGGAQVSVEARARFEETINNSSITAYIIGGNGETAAQAITSYQNLVAFLSSGGNYSKDSPGAPIAYKLAHLADNTPARLSFSDDYEATFCQAAPADSVTFRVTLESLTADTVNDPGDNLEIYGDIVASYFEMVGGEYRLMSRGLLSLTADEWVALAQGTSWPPNGTGIASTVIAMPIEAFTSGGAYLTGHLYESDAFGAFQDFGIATRTVLPDSLAGSYTLRFVHEGSAVVATLRIDVL